MTISEILNKCDHTLLSPTATWEEIKAIIDDGIAFKTASVCIPGSFVKRAAEYAAGRVPICTVIGFPNGYQPVEVKMLEAELAVKDGADEIDTVIDLGDLKDGNYEKILSDLNKIKAACHGRTLKVIIETCYLTEEEKIKMCEIVSVSGADFIKTSTGFGTAGATREDIALFKKHMTGGKRIKAAGGISSLEDAEAMIALGADRLGTSRIVKLAKNQEGFGY